MGNHAVHHVQTGKIELVDDEAPVAEKKVQVKEPVKAAKAKPER